VDDTSSTTTRRRSAAKIVGSIGAIGAAAAIAGLGTFGTFTDSTAPVNTNVDTGVLSIDISNVGAGASVPFDGGLLVAGDSRTHLIDLVNDGTSPLSAVTLRSNVAQSSILDADPVNGLQLTVESCSVAWDESGVTPVCTGTKRSYYTTPIVTIERPLNATPALAPGAVDHLMLTASLPTGATGDAYEGATSKLNFVFTGYQRSGSPR
jgi:hypothetical protein